MEKTIATITNKWSCLKWYERKFYATCLFIYLLFMVTQVLDHLQIGSKLLNVIPLLLALFLVIYLLCLPFLVKTLPIKLPYAQVLSSEEDWKSFKSIFNFSLLYFSILPSIVRNFLAWAPLRLKVLVMVLVLFLIIYVVLFSKPSLNENLTTQEARTLDTNKAINRLSVAFIMLMIFIGLLIYYVLQK